MHSGPLCRQWPTRRLPPKRQVRDPHRERNPPLMRIDRDVSRRVAWRSIRNRRRDLAPPCKGIQHSPIERATVAHIPPRPARVMLRSPGATPSLGGCTGCYGPALESHPVAIPPNGPCAGVMAFPRDAPYRPASRGSIGDGLEERSNRVYCRIAQATHPDLRATVTGRQRGQRC